MTIDQESVAMLRRAGLCICEARMIESHHPGLMNDDLVLIRIEEEEGRAEYEAAVAERKVKCEFCDEEKPGRRTWMGNDEQCQFCGGTGKRTPE